MQPKRLEDADDAVNRLGVFLLLLDLDLYERKVKGGGVVVVAIQVINSLKASPPR